MGEDIYAKGRRLVASEKVVLTDETNRARYFEVTGDSAVHQVRLMRDNSFNCTCAWGSLKGATYGALCSHVVAAVMEAARLTRDAAPGDAGGSRRPTRA